MTSRWYVYEGNNLYCSLLTEIGYYCMIMFQEKKNNLKAPNTTKADLANTADPDERAHNELSHQKSSVCLLDFKFQHNVV